MKVLIVRIGAMGDVLHALPAVAALRAARPEWQIDWAVDERWAPLLVNGEGAGPIVHAVHTAPVRSWKDSPLAPATFGSIRVLRRALRAQKYDAVVDMQGTIRSAIVGRLAGAKRFAGCDDPRERPARRLYREKIMRRGAHVVEQGAALLGDVFGLKLSPQTVSFPLEPWAENWAEHEAVVSRPMCVLAARAGWGAKQWPEERFAQLAQRLQARGFDVVLNTPRQDDAAVQSVIAASSGAARMVVCNVSGLLALMRRADLLVGGDTGPMHLAAALAVPTVALFGPTDPARNGPWGPGKHTVLRHASSGTSYKHVETIDRGLHEISVDEVLAAVDQVIVRPSS